MIKGRYYHFIGIGGIGMSGIANLYLRRGIRVSGSDLKETKVTAGLKNLGATLFYGHDAANVGAADTVVYSSAIKADNPEIIAAKAKGISLLKRAEALAQLMQDRVGITVTGSHGKTTTTSLVSCLLLEAGLMPTVAIGGILKNIESNVSSGEGNFFVAEADESDGSFLYYRPKYSIITNIDYEHLDYYQNFANALLAFKEFIQKTEQGGCVFACGDDPNLKNILSSYPHRYILYGLGKDNQVRPGNIEMTGLNSAFDCYDKEQFVARFQLPLGGEHNICNSLAVIALAQELGIGLEVVKKALAEYKGAGRRIEVKFQDRDYLIIDDYAHHPTEIRATLAAVKKLKPKRLIAVFQPHRFSRTRLLLDEFGQSFALADYVIVTDIYPASEPPIEGISGERVYEKIKEHEPDKEAYFFAKEDIVGHILKNIRPGDLVITLGAGDIIKTNEELVAGLKG
jgi:UDP-N-acetylmuramate--alanine ligase